MVEVKWEDAVVSVWGNVVEVYEGSTALCQGNVLIKIKCESEKAATRVREVLVEHTVDWETFTSLSDL